MNSRSLNIHENEVPPITILLVDDHALFRKGLALVLQHSVLPSAVVREAASVREALVLLQTGLLPHLILLDIQMPDVTGLGGLPMLRQACPTAVVAMMSALVGRPAVTQAFELGADGFISKSVEAEDVPAIVQGLLKGQRHFAGFDTLATSAKQTNSKVQKGLTSRQVEVLRLLAKGHANKRIAKILGLSENTVRVHVTAIFQSLGCNSRTEAAFMAQQQGLLPPQA